MRGRKTKQSPMSDFMSNNNYLNTILLIEESFYKEIEPIKPKNNNDYNSLKNIDKHLLKLIDDVINILNNTKKDPELINILKARLVLDIYFNFAEKNGFNTLSMLSMLTKKHIDLFEKAQKDISILN